MTTKFYCDKCGKEFDYEEDCEEHERLCGIDISKLHFALYDKQGKKLSFSSVNFCIGSDYSFIYIEDVDTFTILNKFWDKNGYVTIPAKEFERKSIYFYDTDGWKEKWVNYTRVIRQRTKQLEEMMAEV